MRTLLSLAFVAAILGSAGAGETHAAPAAKCIPPIKCCRICDKGQACGNTCIAADKNCHKGRGCACNVSEVCAEDP
jgi:hypothetical protein